MSLLQFFELLAFVYIGVGLWTAVRVGRRWGELWDDQLTDDDRRLAARAGFFLLLPPTIALHELGHAVAIWAYGLRVTDWRFLGYVGMVVPEGSAGPLGDFVIALAGNAVTLAVGVGSWGVVARFPGHPVRNILGIELGNQSLFLVLVFYPALCLFFEGDWRWIYDFSATPVASSVTALIHAALLIVGVTAVRKRWAPRAALLCSPGAKSFSRWWSALRADPTDASAHRHVGEALAARGAYDEALRHLTFAIERGVAEAHTRLLYATCLAGVGRRGQALDELDRCQGLLWKPEDRAAARSLRDGLESDR